jgi:NADPH:quinone reductase-like Zn-dependent oxidoreductase
MKAARVHQWGPPDVIAIENIDVPEPGDEEVLVRVYAAGVGPWDALVRTGDSGLPQTLPLTLGSEVSGVVEKIGAKTAGFAIGDEVFGATNPRFVDGYGEYAVAAARMIAPKPAELSHIEAASVPVVAVTAWQMLFDHAKAHEGQTVVVHGGGGNVGAYAVQLARSSKLHVIATIHGGGAVSSVVRPDAQRAEQFRVRPDSLIVDVNTAQLAQLAGMLRRKEIRTAVGSVVPLADARAAHQMLGGTLAHKRGKIVLQVA